MAKETINLFGTLTQVTEDKKKEWRFVWNTRYSEMANIRLDSRMTKHQAVNRITEFIKHMYKKK